MATRGSIKVWATDYNLITFYWNQMSQSVKDNSTTISWAIRHESGNYGLISSSVSKAWSVSIGGKSYSGSTYIGIGNNDSKTLASGETTLTHGSDGTRSFDISFSVAFEITFAGKYIDTVSGSSTGVRLTDIPQATLPTFSTTDIDMGQIIYINTTAALASYRHDIAYSFGGQDYVSLATGVDKFYAWTIPLTLAEAIPNETRSIVTIKCTTKNGSTVVGTKTAAFYANVPTSVIPSIDSVTFEDTNKTVAENIGSFVAQVSKLKVNIAATAYYGATIKSIKSEWLGKTYTGASWTSDSINRGGTHNIVITVTDSRGRTQSGPKAVTVLDYNLPAIESFSAARYTADGVKDEDGTRVKAPITYSYQSLDGKNSVDLKIEYKRSDLTSWSKLWEVTNHTSKSTTAAPLTDLSTDYQWDLRLTLTDKAGSRATYGAVIPSGAVILDIKANGKGISFFRTATKDDKVDIKAQLPYNPEELPLNAYLTDYLTPGYYVAESAAIAQTVLKGPFDINEPFSLEVRQVGATGNLKQALHIPSKGVFERVSFINTHGEFDWHNWECVYGGPNKLLWSGSNTMASSTGAISLTDLVHNQPSGIVLVFCRQASGTDFFYNSHFVPRQLLPIGGNKAEYACIFNMATTLYDYVSSKYLYISDTQIRGHDDNDAAGTKNGITYNNGAFILRYVIGI